MLQNYTVKDALEEVLHQMSQIDSNHVAEVETETLVRAMQFDSGITPDDTLRLLNTLHKYGYITTRKTSASLPVLKYTEHGYKAMRKVMLKRYEDQLPF